MTCSPARLAANRLNARKSTGPRTPEGKAVARQNATRHGGAASADILGPLDDPALVASRAEALAEELGATGAAGALLARRAAVLSVRMERLAEHNEAATRARMARAVAEADAPRLRVLDRLILELELVGPERGLALRTLANTPEGVDRLLAFADDLVARLTRGGDPATEARRRAWGWSHPETDPADEAAGPAAGAAAIPDAGWCEWIAAEVARWADRGRELAPLRAQRESERQQLALAAAFDPSPEARHAHRYEAAAERGFYQALRSIRQLRRDAEAPGGAGADAAIPTVAEPATTAPVTSDALPPAPEPDAEAAPATTSLGSFRTGVDSARPGPAGSAPMVLAHPAATGVDHRRSRPDPRRLARGR